MDSDFIPRGTGILSRQPKYFHENHKSDHTGLADDSHFHTENQHSELHLTVFPEANTNTVCRNFTKPYIQTPERSRALQALTFLFSGSARNFHPITKIPEPLRFRYSVRLRIVFGDLLRLWLHLLHWLCHCLLLRQRLLLLGIHNGRHATGLLWLLLLSKRRGLLLLRIYKSQRLTR